MRGLALIVGALALLAAALVSYPARPHGAAGWIQANPKTTYCCGEHDCAPLPVGAVKQEGHGWRLTTTGEFFPEGDPHLHPSIDERFWRCHKPDGTTRCLFRPGMGA